jgi:hypothetical protein
VDQRRPTLWRTVLVVGAAVAAVAGGGIAVAASSPTPRQVVSPPAAPSDLIGIAPVRVLDTRNAAGGPIGISPGHKLAAGESIDVAVGGVGAIPMEATSVAINITIDEDASLKSFLTVWPTGQTKPNTSANNAEPGLVSPNSAIFQLGQDGKLSVFNQQGAVNVIIDVTGYFLPAGTTPPTTTPGGTTTTTTAPAGTFGPVHLTAQDDNGCALPTQSVWAHTDMDRSFVVVAAQDGSGYFVTRYDRNGTFTTIPGARHPGCNVLDTFAAAGTGTFTGVWTRFADASTPGFDYNPDATVPATGDWAGFFTAVFGVDVSAQDNTTSYEFDYTNACSDHWRDSFYNGAFSTTGDIGDCT